MKISADYIAKLARINLSEDEKKTFSAQLENILAYIEKLNELDTKDTEPTSHVLELSNVVRDDSTKESLQREDALMNAPDHTEKFYRVPKIIE
jgi:aspartyl-tRNA(Asn)/glutamyl-tRNA(Gln) amidotransferase subunit C